MDEQGKRKRVVCPVSGKDGKTYWMRMGTAYVNRDSSINLYLDCLPTNGRLQVREWDEPKKGDGAAPAFGARQDEMPF